jgi:hypothetical protein
LSQKQQTINQKTQGLYNNEIDEIGFVLDAFGISDIMKSQRQKQT